MTRRQFFAAFVAGIMGIGLAIHAPIKPELELWREASFYAEFPDSIVSMTGNEHGQLLVALANGDGYIGDTHGDFEKIEYRGFIGNQMTVKVC